MLCTLAVSGTFHLAYARAFWRRITAPVLVRLGAFRDATFVEIPEAGHMVHIDQPDALAAAIRRFLCDALVRAAR